MDAGSQSPTWYLYLLECCNGRLYTGIAIDPERRFAVHAAGRGAMFTRINRPLRLLGWRAYPNRSLVSKAEADLKRRDRGGKLAWALENPPVRE
jgi:putative endonuclease